MNHSYDGEFKKLIKSLPEHCLELEGISKEHLDINKFSKKFFTTKTIADSSIDANANVEHVGLLAYHGELMKPHLKLNSLYLLWKQIRKSFDIDTANTAITAHINGDLYINDLIGINFPYCYNFSTMDIATRGMPFIPKIKITPPKHLNSFFGQLNHFSVFASNSVMGAVGLADLLITAAWFAEKTLLEQGGKLGIKTIEQELQSFIYSCNQPFRGGIESGFYNVSVYDDYFLKELVSDYVFPDGTTPNVAIVKLLQDMFLDLINETFKTTTLTFPIITACFSTDYENNIMDTKFLNLISEANKDFGFINIYCGKTTTLSSCCRLRSDKSNEYFNLFGAGKTKIGSLGVITLNLPRTCGKLNVIEDIVNLALKINHVKRELLQKRINDGMLPLYTHNFMELSSQYSTIGIIGINEMCENMNVNITNDDGQNEVEKVLNTITKVTDAWSDSYRYPINLEQVPGENSAVKLAHKDNREIYSNQFIPLINNANMIDRINIQGRFDELLSGGGILHVNVETKISDTSKIEKLIKYIAKKGVIYFALNYNLQKCKNEHISVGKNTTCPICGQDITDNFTRVVGFLTSTKNWNKTRRNEYKERVFYEDINVI